VDATETLEHEDVASKIQAAIDASLKTNSHVEASQIATAIEDGWIYSECNLLRLRILGWNGVAGAFVTYNSGPDETCNIISEIEKIENACLQ
jgi:hypothetical protein